MTDEIFEPVPSISPLIEIIKPVSISPLVEGSLIEIVGYVLSTSNQRIAEIVKPTLSVMLISIQMLPSGITVLFLNS